MDIVTGSTARAVLFFDFFVWFLCVVSRLFRGGGLRFRVLRQEQWASLAAG
jgi:hypothetical protein